MSTTNTLTLMANPVNLQTRLYQHLESKLLDGEAVLVDPNSVAMTLIEGFADIAADYAFAVEKENERRLANRAQTDADLNLHMSDYDYVGSFATPSKATISISLNKDYILNNGVLVNNRARMLVIPHDTIVRLGTTNFSLYYPVQIQVDESTRIPLVTYDISEQHPLMALDSNRVEFREMKYMGFDMITIYLTVYQFVRTEQEIILDKSIGCNEVLAYNDKFYAVRLFTDHAGKRIELRQSLVQDNYDPTVATARLQIEPDISKFIINLPQIYFDLNMLGRKLYMELFTTLGDINFNVGALPEDQCRIDFNLSGKPVNPLTEPLKFIPEIMINVYSPVTTDGSDGYSFEEKRARIIHGSHRTKAQITPIDLQNYYADYDIKVQRYEDNLTNLIYFVYKHFTDSAGGIIPSANTYLQIFPDTYKTVSTVKKNVDGTYTVLPNTWFKYKENQDICIPLTDTETDYLGQLRKEDLADEYNRTDYARTPFHIRLVPHEFYPTAISYNLMTPTVEKMTITADNPNAQAQMLALSEYISHEGHGSDGYTVKLIVKKDLLNEIPESDIVVWISTRSTSGAIIGTQATKFGTVDELDIYEFKIKTDYWITSTNEINLTNFKDGNTDLNHRVNLTNKYEIIYLVNAAHYPGVDTPLEMYHGVPDQIQIGKSVLLRQSMTIKLGHALDNVVYNHVNWTKTRQEYVRYEIDIPRTYDKDVYETDSNGVPKYQIVNGKVVFTVLHHAGDVIIGPDGEPEIKHPKGSIKLDSMGKPILKSERAHEYLINAPIFDGKMYLSEHPLQMDMVERLIKTFESNFQIIRDAKGYVTERTNVYFKPSRTMGTTKYLTGDGHEVSLPLDLTMRFRAHVDRVVIGDPELKKTILDSVANIINEYLKKEVISQTEIAKAIKNRVAYIESVDALGIQKDVQLQTLTNHDSSAQPSIRKELKISQDGKLILEDVFTFEFVSAD